MDRLEADVAALVEEAAAAGEPPAATFGRIHRLAAAAAGMPPAPAVTVRPPAATGRRRA